MNEYSAKGKPFFFAVNYSQDEGYFVDGSTNQHEVFFVFPNGRNKPFGKPTLSHIKFGVDNQGIEAYRTQFDQLLNHLKSGTISLANLTQRTPIETNLSLQDIFTLSQSTFQVYIPNRFVCFSPERFVKISNGTISAYPMKGTIDASVPNAEELLINDKKEIAEHRTTVELTLEELAKVSSEVSVVRSRYIDRIATNQRELLQVSSEVSGNLFTSYQKRLGDTIFTLLPAVSVTGVPKSKAYDIINSIEQSKRGYYCGVAGYFDGEELDTTVLIRFIEEEQARFFYRSGGGITVQSTCEKEYNEVLHKVYLPF